MPKLNDDDRMAWIDSHFVTVVLVVLTLLILSYGAVGSPACLTKQEARTKYPRAHLYWHGPGRCWDNRHGRPRRQYRDPVFPKVAMAAAMPVTEQSESREPLILVPGELDPMMRFAPWEQRVTGNFH